MPETLVLPDDRKRLTRFFILAQRGVLPPDLDLPWGTADFETSPPSGWEGLRLIARQMTDEIPPGTKDSHPIVMMIYEQIHETNETVVGGPITVQLEDGRTAVTDESVQFSTGTYTPTAVGTEDPSRPGYYLLKEEAVDDGGLRRIKRTWVEGGLVTVSIETRADGLRAVTHVSYVTKSTPSPGVVISDTNDNVNGFDRFTVTVMQSADGGAPTDATVVNERYVNFVYPGRAKPYTITFLTFFTVMDVFKSPPVEVPILATVTVTYTDDEELDIDDLWAPDEWATLTLQMVTYGPEPISLVQALSGYRSVDDTPMDLTGDGVGGCSAMGYNIFGSSVATVTVEGGPAAPDGNEYTLSAEMELAFVSTTGTKYFRKTVVSATIPNQPALPV